MNTFPLILAIFVVAMISIINNTKIVNANRIGGTIEVTEIAIVEATQNTTSNLNKNNKVIEKSLVRSDYDEFHTPYYSVINTTINVDSEIQINLEKPTALENTKLIKEIDLETENDTADTTFSFNKPAEIAQTKLIKAIDLETENDTTDTTFSFNKPTDIAQTKLIKAIDLETENDTTDTTFSFNKPTDIAQTKPAKASKQDQIQKELAKVDYWDTVHSIESKQGRLLYRPRNKSRSCTYTTSPCGHHQLTVKALKDIGCKSLQCRKDRLNYSKSLEMSKKLLAKNEKRLKKNGYQNLEDYQRYLIHQQGASGIKLILGATKGEKLLNRRIKKNMANNSPYSYRQLNRMGSRLAANIFLSHWKSKWEKEKYLVAGVTLASNQATKNKTSQPKTLASNQTSVETLSLPLFNENEIQLALNYKF